MRENLAGLAHDALSLAELQFQLLSVDLRDARRGAGTALAQLVIGSVLALGSIPIVLTAGVYALVEYLHWTPPAAYGAVSLAAVIAAMLLLFTGWKRAIRALSTVQRSRAELTETLRWLKSSLRDDGCAGWDRSGNSPRDHSLN